MRPRLSGKGSNHKRQRDGYVGTRVLLLVVLRCAPKWGKRSEQPTTNTKWQQKASGGIPVVLVDDLHRRMCCKPSGKVQEGREGLLMGKECDWWWYWLLFSLLQWLGRVLGLSSGDRTTIGVIQQWWSRGEARGWFLLQECNGQ